MAFNQQNFTSSYQCAEDLSANQFCFVNLGTDLKLYGGDKTSLALGVLTDIPSATALGQYAGTVATHGITRVCVGGVYPVGTFLIPAADGATKGVGYSVADAAASTDFIRARTMEPSVAAGDIVACELLYNPYGDVVGMTGVQGITGLRGITGANGLTGVMGITGMIGITGIQGITGVQGLTGLMADQGLTGVQGITGLGYQGITGVDGITGVQGLTGLMADQGITGVQGITGLMLAAGGVTGYGNVPGGSTGIYVTADINGSTFNLLTV